MKKLVIILIAVCVFLSGCGNKDMFDTVYTFDRVILSLPNGEVIEGEVDTWKDYQDGDQIQIKINGITYLVHSSNVTLIAEG
jgi:uncharacterized lipoprotein NlpE involved in copper resistance